MCIANTHDVASGTTIEERNQIACEWCFICAVKRESSFLREKYVSKQAARTFEMVKDVLSGEGLYNR
jgi:hypothetical protein